MSGDLDLGLETKRRFFKGNREIVAQVISTSTSAAPAATAAENVPENITENILEGCPAKATR